MVNQLTCKQCKGLDFKQISPSEYRCIDCGTVRTVIKPTRSVTKKRKQIPKESISTRKEYQPVTLFCETCGDKLGRIGSPLDFKRFKNKWEKHTCKDKKGENLYQ